MEQACTEHLKEIGGYLAPEFKKIEFSAGNFEYEASVIIPVRNRIRTIRDAIKSVLMQKTDFKYNLIIIDNHSTDGTTEAIDEFKDDERLIHIVPERNDLGIGGCWNVGVHHPSVASLPCSWTATTYTKTKTHSPSWYAPSTNRTAPWW